VYSIYTWLVSYITLMDLIMLLSITLGQELKRIHSGGVRIDNREEVIDYFNAQFVAGNEWIGDMVGDEAVWNLHQKKMQSFHYNFERDINTIYTEVCNEGTLPFDSVFDIDDDASHPPIIKLLLQDDIMIETVIVLNELLGFIPRLKITETLVWPDLKNKILKYGNMLDGKINTKKCKKTLLNVFTF
jgi:hypothetical protein